MNRALTYLILLVIIGAMLTGLYQCGVTAGERAKDLAYAPKMEELRQCAANSKVLQASVAKQNAQIDKLKAAGEAAEQRADGLVAQAKVISRAHVAKAQAVLMAEPKVADRCEAAAILLRENLQ